MQQRLHTVDLLLNMRDSLDEDSAEKWTDAKLVRFLTRAYLHVFARQAMMLKGRLLTTGLIDIVAGTALYDMPAPNHFIKSVWVLVDDEYISIDEIVNIDSWREESEFSTYNGTIYRWYLEGEQIGLAPEPATGVTNGIKVKYLPMPGKLHAGTAEGGDTTYITLDADSTYGFASNEDDIYNGMVVRVLTGTGANQVATITDYTGSNRRAMATFAVAPVAGDTYALYPKSFAFLDELIILKACEIAFISVNKARSEAFAKRFAMEEAALLKTLHRSEGPRYGRFIPRGD